MLFYCCWFVNEIDKRNSLHYKKGSLSFIQNLQTVVQLVAVTTTGYVSSGLDKMKVNQRMNTN